MKFHSRRDVRLPIDTSVAVAFFEIGLSLSSDVIGSNLLGLFPAAIIECHNIATFNTNF